MLRINTPKGYVDLTTDFSIQIDETSPVLNDRGSQSVPVTLPLTKKNKIITDFAHRIDIANDPMQSDASCVITDGVYYKRGLLNVGSAGKDGIEINIGIDNSEAYSQWNKKRLKELSNLPMYQYPTAIELFGYLDQVLDGKVEADFALFQVVLSNESTTEEKKIEIDGITLKREVHTYYPEILNQIQHIQKGNVWSSTLRWKAHIEYFIIDGARTKTLLPDGYGISPFLYVWKVLEYVFAEYGYKIKNNIFKTDFELSRLVVLNNVIDACTKNFINYRELMPDCTIESFLNSLYVRFGLLYNVDSTTRLVTFMFMRDLVSASPGIDITSKKSADPVTTFNAKKQLQLSCNTSLDGAAPAEERYEDYRPKIKGKMEFVQKINETNPKAEFYYEITTGRIFTQDQRQKVLYGGKVEFSSRNFSWDRQTDNMENETLSSDDEAIYMGYNGRFGELFLSPYYMTGAVFKYTELITASFEDKKDEKKEETPLAFAFAYNQFFNKEYPFGSNIPVLPDGHEIEDANGVHTLTLLFQFKNGLFDRFWKEYDAILRHSYNTIDVPLNLSIAEIMAMNPLIPLSISGQNMIIDTFGYKLPAGKIVPVDMTLRSLKLLKPCDLVTEQYITEFKANNYYWKPDILNRKEFFENEADYFRANINDILNTRDWVFIRADLYCETWLSLPKSPINLDLYPPTSMDDPEIKGAAHISLRFQMICIDEYKEETIYPYTKDYHITGVWTPSQY